jgi:hypothetical protein
MKVTPSAHKRAKGRNAKFYRMRTAARKAKFTSLAKLGVEKIDAAFCKYYTADKRWGVSLLADPTQKATADSALGEGACDLALIRRYARTSWRWVGAYRKGLDGVLACWAVRKSKAHRCVTGAVDREVNKLVEEKQKIASARAAPVAPPLVLAGVAAMAAAGALGDDDDD